ncbi:DUF6510 family protein [Nonomuraea sp. NPDC050310]|uniref:DUF6510 family protein n=1 Tax=Nonomuraea sp. NPDC050310 TaxID=3154935 RepID=UPI0033FE62AA
MTELDANSAAGPLTLLFGRDVTLAVGICAMCGTTGPLGETVMYGPAPGTVLRCPQCSNVLMTIVEAPDRLLATMPGLRLLSVPTGGTS